MVLLYFLLQLPPVGYHPGWPTSYPPEARVSTGLSLVDINGNGNCEVLSQIMYTLAKIGTLYVYDHQANELWTFSNDTIIWLPAFTDVWHCIC